MILRSVSFRDQFTDSAISPMARRSGYFKGVFKRVFEAVQYLDELAGHPDANNPSAKVTRGMHAHCRLDPRR
jgi:hypothetical protein